MSIATAITNLQGRVESAYDKIEEKGGALPQVLNTANLPDAIDSIPQEEIDKRKFGTTIDEVFHVQYVDNKHTLGLFGGCTDLNFTGITNVWSYALAYTFRGCTNLKSVSFPDLLQVGEQSGYKMCFYSAFYGCTSLSSVSFPSLTSVGGNQGFQEAFNGCGALTTVTFPSLQSMSGRNTVNVFTDAFKNCTGLTSISFPALAAINGIATMQDAFSGCTNLVEIHFGQAHQAAIEAHEGYSTKWGAPNANCQIYFDL